MEEVVQFCKGLWPDFEIFERLLKNPSSTFVIDFYCRFLMAIQALVTFTWDGDEVQVIDYREKTPLELMVVNKYITRSLNHKVGQDDILFLTDLYEPTSKRTVFFFKLLLNILASYKKNSASILDVVQKCYNPVLSASKIISETAKCREDLGKLAEQITEHTETLKRAKRDYEDTKGAEDVINMDYEKDGHQIQKGQLELDQAEMSLKIKLKSTQDLEVEMENLKSEIVDPDYFNNLLARKKQLQKKMSESKSSFVNIENVQHQEGELHEKMKNIAAELLNDSEKLKEMHYLDMLNEKRLSDVQEKYKSVIEEDENLNKNISQVDERITEKKANYEAFMVQFDKMVTDKNQATAQLKHEINEKKLWHANMKKECDEVNEKIKHSNNVYDTIVKEMEDFGEFCNNAREELVKSENDLVLATKNLRNALVAD